MPWQLYHSEHVDTRGSKAGISAIIMPLELFRAISSPRGSPNRNQVWKTTMKLDLNIHIRPVSSNISFTTTSTIAETTRIWRKFTRYHHRLSATRNLTPRRSEDWSRINTQSSTCLSEQPETRTDKQVHACRQPFPAYVSWSVVDTPSWMTSISVRPVQWARPSYHSYTKYPQEICIVQGKAISLWWLVRMVGLDWVLVFVCLNLVLHLTSLQEPGQVAGCMLDISRLGQLDSHFRGQGKATGQKRTWTRTK